MLRQQALINFTLMMAFAAHRAAGASAAAAPRGSSSAGRCCLFFFYQIPYEKNNDGNKNKQNGNGSRIHMIGSFPVKDG